MKKILSIILVISIMLVGLFLLTGCGKSKMSTVAGIYKGLYTKLVGESEDEKDEEKPFSLELKADGTGKHSRDGETYDLTWSIEDNNFKMTETFLGIKIEYEGTLTDNKLDIFNGDKTNDFTCEYVYEKSK